MADSFGQFGHAVWHAVARGLRGVRMRPDRGMAQSGSASALGAEGQLLKPSETPNKNNILSVEDPTARTLPKKG